MAIRIFKKSKILNLTVNIVLTLGMVQCKKNEACFIHATDRSSILLHASYPLSPTWVGVWSSAVQLPKWQPYEEKGRNQREREHSREEKKTKREVFKGANYRERKS